MFVSLVPFVITKGYNVHLIPFMSSVMSSAGTGLAAERRWIVSKLVPKQIYSFGLHGTFKAWGNAIIVTNRSLITPGTDSSGFRGRFGNKETVVASGAIVTDTAASPAPTRVD